MQKQIYQNIKLGIFSLILSLPPALVPGKHNSTPIAACSGYNPARLTFTTAPSGGLPPYAYQWQQNSVAIPGETLSSYDPPQLTAAGVYGYNCSITDAAGTTVFTEAKLITIVPDPGVTISGGGIMCLNSTITLTSFITDGTGAYTFQWDSGPSAAGPWTPVPGATADHYSPVTSAAGTVYYRLNLYPSAVSCNNVTSTPVAITVNPPLAITAHPMSQSDCKWNSVVFGVTLSGGTAPVTCTWQRKRPTDPSFADITGDPDITWPAPGTLHVDKTGSVSNPNGTQYRVVMADACGTLATSPATLTVHEITGIIPVTNFSSICEGASVSYAVTTSTVPLSYQWLKDGVPITNGAVYSGASTAKLMISDATPAETGRYQVQVIFSITVPNNNGGGATTCSETSTLDRYLLVNPLPAISAIYHR